MTNTPYDQQAQRQRQLERIQKVIRHELTPLQREALTDHYFNDLSISQIAQKRGVNKSTVSRTIHRAEVRLRRCLKY